MKRRKSSSRTKRSPAPQPQQDLSAISTALLGMTDTDEPDAVRRQAESVEDPLADWPESAGEADHWQKSRPVRRDEEREG